MNIYFLVEGEQTEKKVYPAWLSILLPEMKSVEIYTEVVTNNYFLEVGYGSPYIINKALKNSVSECNAVGIYDYLVICLDGDDLGIEETKELVLKFIEEENIVLNSNTKLEIIVQNKCFETWFLGNRIIFKQNPQSETMKEFNQFYNVKTDDPELMEKPDDFGGSTAMYHFKYLQEIFMERNTRYNKKNPTEVIKESFLEELIKRNEETGHIKSFKYFIDFCSKIRKETEK